MKIWKIILSVLIFLSVQGAGGVVAALICGKEALNADTLAWLTVITGIISVIIIWLALKTIKMKDTFTPKNIRRQPNWMAGIYGIGGSVAGIVAITLISEQVDLPNWLENDFLDMSQSWIGMISIGIVAPIVEELVFRESIEGHLLRQGCKPWIAIAVSSLAFGLIHMNPAQVPFAAMVGVLLGILYWKTRNVLLCSILHIINNITSIMSMRELGRDALDYKLSDKYNTPLGIWFSIAIMFCICYVFMWFFIRMYARVDEKKVKIIEEENTTK